MCTCVNFKKKSDLKNGAKSLYLLTINYKLLLTGGSDVDCWSRTKAWGRFYNLETHCKIMCSSWIISFKIRRLSPDKSCFINVFYYRFYSLSAFVPHPTPNFIWCQNISGSLILLLYLNDSHPELIMIVVFDFWKPGKVYMRTYK